MTVYYIHPDTGSDSNDGLTPGTAWRSFEPVSKRELEPGDVVDVLAPGRLEHTIAIRGRGRMNDPIRIKFAPGRYDLFPDHMTVKAFHISNCNSAPHEPKTLAIWFEGAEHVHVDGQGAMFFCRGKMIEMCFDHAQHITIHGLAFDYHRPTVSEWAVLEASPTEATLAVHPDSTYELRDHRLIWLGEGWSYETGLAQELIPKTHSVWRRKDPLLGLKVEELEPGKLRVTGQHDMVAGRVYQLRDTFRDCCGVFMQRSRDITLDSVHFAFMHGMGVLAQFTQNITLRNVTIAPRPQSGRSTAAWADGTHFSGCRGTLTVEGCHFSGAHDDAMNVHGTYLQIQDQPDARQLKVMFKHPQTYGFQAFDPGDEIAVIRSSTLQSVGRVHIEAVEMLSETEQLLTLDQDVPNWESGDVVENLTWSPQVLIRDCTVERIPTRGFLLSSPKKIVVEGCTFTRMVNGIHAEGEAEQWFESGSVKDMTIRHNRFIECRKAAIRIGPHHETVAQTISENVRIENNTFTLLGNNPAVDLLGVQGVTITGNVITHVDNQPGNPKWYVLKDCKDVDLSDSD